LFRPQLKGISVSSNFDFTYPTVAASLFEEDIAVRYRHVVVRVLERDFDVGHEFLRASEDESGRQFGVVLGILFEVDSLYRPVRPESYRYSAIQSRRVELLAARSSR
jgi:hypothetical protein